jgi:NADH-quinone oxidoreductase subunit A
MNPYIPVLIVMVFGIVIGGALSGLAYLLGPKKFSSTKFEPYECGVPIVSQRDKMSVKFYLTAILFILFDIETVFLYLWAKTFRVMGFFGLIEVALFLLVLLVGYIYVIKRRALEWE